MENHLLLFILLLIPALASSDLLVTHVRTIKKRNVDNDLGHISFKPTLDQQRNCANCSQSLLDGDFIVRYDVKRTTPDNLQIVNGYFVHFFAPTNLPKLPKNIIFVIDISGSMAQCKQGAMT